MKTKITSRYGLILVRRVTTSIGEKLKESSPRVGSGLTPCYLLTASELTHHCSLMACKLTHLATMETGREILPPQNASNTWPTPYAPQRLHTSMSQTHRTQVLTHNSWVISQLRHPTAEGWIRKHGLYTMEPFSHKEQQSQVLCGTMCVTGDDHVNKLRQCER